MQFKETKTIWIATNALLLNRSSRNEIHKTELAKWQPLPGILTALAKCHWDSQRWGFGFWIKMPRPLTSRKVCPKLDHRICHFRPISHRLTSLPHWANVLWLKVTSNDNRRTSLPHWANSFDWRSPRTTATDEQVCPSIVAHGDWWHAWLNSCKQLSLNATQSYVLCTKQSNVLRHTLLVLAHTLSDNESWNDGCRSWKLWQQYSRHCKAKFTMGPMFMRFEHTRHDEHCKAHGTNWIWFRKVACQHNYMISYQMF